MPPKYRPPMWSSKVYGEPHGMWEKKPGESADDVAAAAAGRPRVAVSASRLMQMEGQLRDAVEVFMGGQRNYVRQYLTKTDALVRVLEVGDTNRPAGIRMSMDPGAAAPSPGQAKGSKVKPLRWAKSGKLDKPTFQNLLERRLGLRFVPMEIAALFSKYGHDRQGLMPYSMFARRLFSSQAKILAMQGFQHGAYSTERPMEWGFDGMIKYPFCKQAVCPPSEWDKALVARSNTEPPNKLVLEHVYGYSNSKNVAPNLFYTKTGEIVYYTAAVGIVYSGLAQGNTQRFFLGHDDDICCLGMHPDRDTVCTGQFGAVPKVLIWSAETCLGPEVMRDPAADENDDIEPVEIEMPYGDQAVVACAFGGLDGRFLFTISSDDGNSIRVWNWKTGANISNAKGYSGTPPQVFGVVCNPFTGIESASQYDFVTFGKKHIYFWTLDVATKAISSKNCVFGKCTQQDQLHAAFLPTGEVLSGGENGGITFWRDGAATHEVTPLQAHKGPCTVLRLRKDRETLLSAGADSKVIVWTIVPNEEGVMQLENPDNTFFMLSEDGQVNGVVVGLDCKGDDDTFVAGDSKNDIWEVDADPEVMVQGMSDDVCGLAPHPLLPHIYATASADGTAYVWDARQRKCIAEVAITRRHDERGGKEGRKGDALKVFSVAYSNQGDLMAVGTSGVVDTPDHIDRGGVLVLMKLNPASYAEGLYPLREVAGTDGVEQDGEHYFNRKVAKEALYDLKFSPDGTMLAAACRDTTIHVFDVTTKKLKRVGHCTGHSSSVEHLDWSRDSKVLMSTSKDMELLYWEPSAEGRGWGKSSNSQRDTAWDSYSCPLGFTVMGIWQDDMDGSDINALHRSPSEQLVAACDDDGAVRLYNWPCVIDKAPHHANVAGLPGGHASHVANVRFIDQGRRLASCGGRDRALLQWVLSPEPALPGVEPEPAVMTEAEALAAKAGGGASGAGAAAGEVKVGKVQDLQVELRVRELHSLVQMQKKELASKQAEITRLMQMLGT